jgi:hypothetical protein
MSHEARSIADWVSVSKGLERFEPLMLVAVQGLGRLDEKLAAQDKAFLALSEAERVLFQTSSPTDLMERITLSYLWVLGIYEIVRALDHKCRTDVALVAPTQAAEVTRTKIRIERVRIPLAKFEQARRFAMDSAVAYPVLHKDYGVAWLVSRNTLVSREELAQVFLRMLEVLSA